MQLSLVGINHQTAPVAIREKVAVRTEGLLDSLSLLRSYLPQGVILSTCNRTEIYATGNSPIDLEKASLRFLIERAGVSGTSLRRHVYLLKDSGAAHHLFRTTSGLESMIIGEFEVLGQVKQALEIAEQADMVNLPLRQVFTNALQTGRRVREETGISRNALSVSSVAVDLAAGIVGDLEQNRMLVIGAGEAGRLVAKVAKDRRIARIVIASRTKERARVLAETLQGIPADLDSLDNELNTATIVVTCAGAPHRILSASRVHKAMCNRPDLPLVIVDIALPRNVEPEVGRINNVFLYNIDDLTAISEANRKQREDETQKAEKIVAEEIEKFNLWWQQLDVRPLVGALMSKAERIRSAQLDITLKKLPPLSAEQREDLEAMTKSIVARILNDPIQFLKANTNGYHAEALRELFQLGSEGNK